ncbi:MAG: hypothetical protein LBH40_03180 [Alphaproteobacteria bacterium]|jgi:hypothetical protein|nr:hypothetical protein [Alphaproteobacteria bacterium]
MSANNNQTTQQVQPFSPKASAYILTLISRLDTAICFHLFKYFYRRNNKKKDLDLIDKFLEFNENKLPKEGTIEEFKEEFERAIKSSEKNKTDEIVDSISYPFDIFGTPHAIKFFNNWGTTTDFAKYLSKEMIIYTGDKKTNFVKNLVNIFLLRQELEHPNKKDNSLKLIKYKNDEHKYKYDLEDSLKSLFLFLPDRFMNHVSSLLENKEVESIKQEVNKTNRYFRKRLNEKINEEDKNQTENRLTFVEQKNISFMGETNKNMLQSMFTDKNWGEIPKNELYLTFDFILEVQAIFRRYYTPLFSSDYSNKEYKELRNLISHSNLFFNTKENKNSSYTNRFCENLKIALEFYDTEYKDAIVLHKNGQSIKNIKKEKHIIIQTVKVEIKPKEEEKKEKEYKEIIKTENTLKTDFIRSLNALCNQKNYFYIEMSTPKSGNNEGFNTQEIEIKFSKEEDDTSKNNQKCMPKEDMDKYIEATIRDKKENKHLKDAKFEEKKRIYLNLIRQKMKKKIMEIKEKNQSRNNKRPTNYRRCKKNLTTDKT